MKSLLAFIFLRLRNSWSGLFLSLLLTPLLLFIPSATIAHAQSEAATET